MIWKTGEELEITQRVVLIYGPSGSGKTTLCAKAPNPLFLSCDPGQLGGALSAVKANKDVKVVRIESFEQLIKVLDELQKYTTEFNTLIVDSVSYLQRIVMQDILKVIKREIPRFEEWNLLVERMRRLINQIASFETKNIIFTAVDEITKDETTGKLFGGPSLPGKLAKELPQACDIVLRLYASSTYNREGKKEIQYKYVSTPDDIWFAKDRTGELKPEGLIASVVDKQITDYYDLELKKLFLN